MINNDYTSNTQILTSHIIETVNENKGMFACSDFVHFCNNKQMYSTCMCMLDSTWI